MGGHRDRSSEGQEPDSQRQHAGSQSQADAHHCAAMVFGDVHPDRQQDQSHHRQPDPDRGEQAEGTLSSGDRIRLQDRERWIDVRDRFARSNPLSTSRCLTTSMNGPRLMLTVLFAIVMPSPVWPVRRGDECGVLRPVRSHPRVCKRITGHHFSDFGMYEALHSAGQRPGNACSWFATSGGSPRLARASTA